MRIPWLLSLALVAGCATPQWEQRTEPIHLKKFDALQMTFEPPCKVLGVTLVPTADPLTPFKGMVYMSCPKDAVSAFYRGRP